MIAASQALFGRGALEDLSPRTLRAAVDGDADRRDHPPLALGSAPSSAGRRPGSVHLPLGRPPHDQQGGLSVNNVKVTDEDRDGP